jgi:hypothetical protein
MEVAPALVRMRVKGGPGEGGGARGGIKCCKVVPSMQHKNWRAFYIITPTVYGTVQ